MFILTGIIFAFVILLGLTLLTYVIRHKDTPKGLVMTHGGTGFLGIVLLIIYICFFSTSPYISLILFVLAALGGFFLFFRDITWRSVPIFVVLIHGLIGLSAFLILWSFILNL